MGALRRQLRHLRAEVALSQRQRGVHVASMAEMREEVEAVRRERDSKMAALKAAVAGTPTLPCPFCSHSAGVGLCQCGS